MTVPGIFDMKKVVAGLDADSFYKDGSLRHLFSRNEKMVITTEMNDGKYFINFNLPAIETCPCKGKCQELCYATQGRYIFKSVLNAMRWRYKMSKRDDFRLFADSEIEWWKKRRAAQGRRLFVRIHDSGDYYSKSYALKWIDIAEDNPDVVFYSYTKCVKLWHELSDDGKIPENFRVIMSTMGSQDHLIRPDDRRAVIVQDEEHISEGMVNGTGNDYLATYAKVVALPYHGSKKVVL